MAASRASRAASTPVYWHTSMPVHRHNSTTAHLSADILGISLRSGTGRGNWTMARADEMLIRDDDLRQKLEEARGKFGFDIVARTLVTTQEKRDQDRAVAEAKQAELNALTPVQRRQRIV